MIATHHRFEVTQEIIDTFERDGVVMLDQPFGPGGVDDVADAVMGILDKYDAGAYLGDICRVGGRFEVTGAVGFEPVIRNWILKSQAAEIVGKILGAQTVRLYTDHDICFGKSGPADIATAGATSFHVDGSAWGFLGNQIPSFWTALVDVGATMGPLVVAAGSHKKLEKLFLPSPSDPDAEIAEGYAPYGAIREFLDKNKFPMKVFPAKKGDVVMLSPRVVHGSLPKREDGLRVALSTRWLGDDPRWHASHAKPSVQRKLPEFAEGSLPSDEYFPIIWDAARGNVSHLPGVMERHTLTEPKPVMSYTEHGRIETQNYINV